METDPDRWIGALRRSHDSLRALAGPLTADQLAQRSYCPDWSVAQVFSHLGSQAEAFGLWLDAGLSGQDPPGQDALRPIWAAWNAKAPQAQVADSLRANEQLIERFESLDAGQRDRFRLPLFGQDLDLAGLARLRLSEHAVHSWDVAVALDPAATVAPEPAGLLVDTLGQLAAWTGKADGTRRRVHVETSTPPRQFTLETGDAVTLEPSAGELSAGGPSAGAEGGEPLPELRLPAEALIRLVYGRLDPAHTPPVEIRGVDLGELRPIFPGL